MAASVEELKKTLKSMATQFTGFQNMMTTSLDKLKSLETWQATAEESLGTLLKSSLATTARVEERLPTSHDLSSDPCLRHLHRRHCTGICETSISLRS
jgi:septation ring formation regulator EzrA